MSGNSAGNATVTLDNASYVEQAVQPLEVIQFIYFALWGMYTVLFCAYGYFQVNFFDRNRKRPLIYPALLTLLYIFVTLHTVLNTLSFNRALTSRTIIQLSYDPSFFSALASGKQRPDFRYLEFLKLNFVGESCYMIASFIADGLLLYRCYHLWVGRKSIIAVPFVLYILNFCLFIAALVTEATFEKDFETPFLLGPQQGLGPALMIGLAFALTTIITNLVLTALIAGRIFWLTKRMNTVFAHNSKTFFRLVAIVSESGFLYTFSLAVGMCFLSAISPVKLLPITAQTMGIAPTLIMVRMDLRATVENVSEKELSKETV